MNKSFIIPAFKLKCPNCGWKGDVTDAPINGGKCKCPKCGLRDDAGKMANKELNIKEKKITSKKLNELYRS